MITNKMIKASINDVENHYLIDAYNVFHEIYRVDVSGGSTVECDVRDIDAWNAIIPSLCELMLFSTRREWRFRFNEVEHNDIEVGNGRDYNIQRVQMFSGGIDSLAGFLEAKNNGLLETTMFVTIRSNPEETSRSSKLFKREMFGKDRPHAVVKPVKDASVIKPGNMARTLYFFITGAIHAKMYDVDELNIFENGTTAFALSGDLSIEQARTVHPKTIELLQNVINLIGINVRIIHNFRHLTKSEVINKILEDENGVEYLESSRSCSSGTRAIYRVPGSPCGTCIACVTNKFSLYNVVDNVNLNYQVDDIRGHEIDEGNIGTAHGVERGAYNFRKQLVSMERHFKMMARRIDNGTASILIDLTEEDRRMMERTRDEINRWLER